MAQGCAVATTNDGKQRVIYLLTTKTPSQGLTPESQQTNLIAFDPSNPQPTAKKPFSSPTPGNEVDANWSIYPASGEFVVAHWS